MAMRVRAVGERPIGASISPVSFSGTPWTHAR
jgi:hypothetical protein